MTRPAGGHRHGFTLVELSIVLVIIGLIVGGVLVGQDMIRGARLKSVTRDFTNITSATNMFRAKYNAYPGDMATATAFNLGNNGNGNGQIAGFPFADNGEMWLFWQHLANAQMWKGVYSGTGSGRGAVVGVNVPRSAIDGAGFTVTYWNAYTDGNDWTPPVESTIANHVIFFGRPDSNAYGNYETYAPALTPSEALAMDLKMDDGLPASGKLIVMGPVVFSNCVTSNNAATAAYRVSVRDFTCGLTYIAF